MAPSCRSPSSSTSTRAGRRSTSTGRSCGRSSRSGHRGFAAGTDALIALEELHASRLPAIFARAHAGPRPSEDEALFRTVLLGLLVSTAEACGGFDWDDESSTAPMPSSSARCTASAAPTPRSRRSSASRSRRSSSSRPGCGCARSPTGARPALARGGSLMPKDFGRETDRYCMLELRAALAGAEDPPDAPAEIADAVSAIRLATAAPLSAGPVLFETLDGRPFGIRPVLPIAATQPPGRTDPPRLVPRRARRRAAAPARSRRRRQRSRRGARSLGALAVPERAVPLDQLRAGVRGTPRRDVAAPGRRAARGRARASARRSTPS